MHGHRQATDDTNDDDDDDDDDDDEGEKEGEWRILLSRLSGGGFCHRGRTW